MPLKEKNSLMKACFFFPCLVLIAFLTSCNNNTVSDSERQASDSISKVKQKLHVDSLKRRNPLLILPPDSNYTGDYIDKYPTGIVKFRGQYRFGQQHGHWLSFYPNGMAWSEMHYDKGKRHGPNITYYEDGKKRYEGFFKLDKKDSIWNYYDSLGKVAVRVLYKNDLIVKRFPVK
jgi:antitoxin component YwqK of YwqJK toxin-antitoxin module